MSSTKVFLIAELLELILFNLPLKDLLRVQRVSRRWNETIIHSPILQQNLFFQPTRSCPQPQENLTVDMNPLLQELFPPLFAGLSTLDDEHVENQGDNIAFWQYTPERHNGEEILRRQEWYMSEFKRSMVLRPEASWRRMYLSNPPPLLGKLDVRLVGCGCGEVDKLYARLGREYQRFNQHPGARMGLIWDAVMFILDDNASGGFAVGWWRKRNRDGEGRKRSWVLEFNIQTEHRWRCYCADESYKLSGLKVVAGEDIVNYKVDDGVEGGIMELEAVPLSVLRRKKREETKTEN
ncbi:hypothetical protein BDW59DRAFT_155189 [Aspergillus cavernicola]|uniref:F-box domain-containing protein n=1 Tax=Aspergillus cavernicola TaxID=176166 RepID=A0ABR4HBC0_9EURO